MDTKTENFVGRDAIHRVRKNRKNIRFEEWDYADSGWYFITICMKDHQCAFDEIQNGELVLNAFGKIVQQCWEDIPKHFENVGLDEFIVMPNHVHGIIVIEKNNHPHMDAPIRTNVGTQFGNNQHPRRDMPWHVPTNRKFSNPEKGSLSMIINHFKGAVTRWCKNNEHSHFSWQPRFYDHIIRDQKSLDKIRQYIHFNADKWDSDEENPKFFLHQ